MTEKDLNKLTARRLKEILKKYGVTNCDQYLEKSELVSAVRDLFHVEDSINDRERDKVNEENDDEKQEMMTDNEENHETNTEQRQNKIKTMKIRELTNFLKKRNIDYSNCIEKRDLIELVIQTDIQENEVCNYVCMCN